MRSSSAAAQDVAQIAGTVESWGAIERYFAHRMHQKRKAWRLPNVHATGRVDARQAV
jgi:hypothetical protein